MVLSGQVDVKTTALAMAITDSELSDEEASILESGGFSVSRATTPQLTDVSEGKPSLFNIYCDNIQLETSHSVLYILLKCLTQFLLSPLYYRPGPAEFTQ